MKNTLIKISPPIWPIFEVEIEIIKKEIENNKAVTLITCDGEKDFCVANEKMSKLICLYCKKRLNDGLNFIGKFHKNQIHYINEKQINSFKKKQLDKIQNIKTKNDLLKIEFKKNDIGRSILSTLVTQFNTENIDITKYKPLIEEIYKQSISALINFQKVLEKNKYNKILIFNGRIYNYRPLLRYSQKNKLNSYCYDYAYFSHKRYLVAKNDFTQNMFGRAIEIKKIALSRKLLLQKEIIKKSGISFFKSRINKKNTGPFAIFNAVQKDILPKTFLTKNFNISFFTSSDLETSLITDRKKRFIYDNQIVAIKKILNKFKNKKINFYVRLHPNFSHDHKNTKNFMNLEKIFDNIEIIKPLSNVSTYKLAKTSDLVIAFGSTIGIESVFLKTNVINLGPSAYKEFKIDFQPNNHKETIDIILKLYKKNKFKNNSYHQSIIAADAMSNQGKKLDYLHRVDALSSYYLINGKKYNLKKIDLIYILFILYFIFSRFYKLIFLFFLNFDQFKFKLFNYIVRLKNIFKN